MRVWTGWGAMVPLTVIAFMTPAILAFALFGAPASWAWAPVTLAGAASGMAIHYLSRAAARAGRDAGTFFFLRTQAWAFIVPAMTVLMGIGLSAPGGMPR